MAFFTDTITLYNYHKDTLTDVKAWNRTVIERVQWTKSAEKVISPDGKILLTEFINVTVPFQSATKAYLNPKEYMANPKLNISSYFTFNYTHNLDVFILGNISKEITDSYTITSLKNDYFYIATISSVTDNTNRDGLRHWKVKGK